MRDGSNEYTVHVGSKRKRVLSGTENLSAGRISRTTGRIKRQRSSADSSDIEVGSSMDVDEHGRWDLTDESDQDHDDDGDLDSCKRDILCSLVLAHHSFSRQLFDTRSRTPSVIEVAQG